MAWLPVVGQSQIMIWIAVINSVLMRVILLNIGNLLQRNILQNLQIIFFPKIFFFSILETISRSSQGYMQPVFQED